MNHVVRVSRPCWLSLTNESYYAEVPHNIQFGYIILSAASGSSREGNVLLLLLLEAFEIRLQSMISSITFTTILI